MDNVNNLTLGEIDQGDLVLHANREIAKIVKDIADPNKIAVKERELNIKVKFKPNKQRSAATVKYSVSSKPAGHVESESDIYLGKDSLGEPIAKPYVPNQQRIPFGETDEELNDAAAS